MSRGLQGRHPPDRALKLLLANTGLKVRRAGKAYVTLPVQFTDVDVTIARTAPKMDGQRAVLEVEQLYLEQIARAKRFIYAESQYFASRRIAEAMARRLDEADGPEIVIVNPQSAQGWLEPLAMDTARARLIAALRQRDRYDRLRLYHRAFLATASGQLVRQMLIQHRHEPLSPDRFRVARDRAAFAQ